MRTFAYRKDKTHVAIKQALEAYGWVVMDVSRAPYVADLIASKAGRTVCIEVKSPGQKPKPHQQRWMDHWQGECCVLTSPDQVQELSR